MAETCETKQLETSSHCNSTTTKSSNLPTEINSKRVPNIIMLGPTGAGKSFFGNGLFGVEKPEEGKINLIESTLSTRLWKDKHNLIFVRGVRYK